MSVITDEMKQVRFARKTQDMCVSEAGGRNVVSTKSGVGCRRAHNSRDNQAPISDVPFWDCPWGQIGGTTAGAGSDEASANTAHHHRPDRKRHKNRFFQKFHKECKWCKMTRNTTQTSKEKGKIKMRKYNFSNCLILNSKLLYDIGDLSNR